MLRESAKISSLPLYNKNNIDRFIKNFILIINKSIETSTSL